MSRLVHAVAAGFYNTEAALLIVHVLTGLPLVAAAGWCGTKGDRINNAEPFWEWP